MSNSKRRETDSMGEMSLPPDALYGASTQRAVENFPVSGIRMPRRMIQALGLIKAAAAQTNVELGQLDETRGARIAAAAREVAEGLLDEHFPVDIFQTGSGTSTNMNANEVIANHCARLAGDPASTEAPVHPNDHVNLGQSSNDVMPAALHLAVALAIRDDLLPALRELGEELANKAGQFNTVLKLGRTHLMDAVPMRLGDEFSAYARQVEKAGQRCQRAMEVLEELAIGGTAVGNGLNTHKEFGARVCVKLASATALRLREAENHFEAQSARDDAVEVAGQLSAVSAALTKIANDVRLLGSGPRGGLGELKLPATQPGSSIMPGKVNPVMSEMLVQVCHYTIGHCQMVTRCGQDGHLELNATIPLISHGLLQSIEVLAHGSRLFARRCIAGLEANEQTCREYAEGALGLATALNPHIGYAKAAEVAKTAHREGKSIKRVALEMNLLDEATLDRILDPESLV